MLHPQTGIDAGSWYLSRALKRWKHTDNPLPFALAEYNAGRTHARRWVDPAQPISSAAFRSRIDFPTTRAYISAIERKYWEYQNNYFHPPWLIWLDRWKNSSRSRE
jgi:soluble lytic murein transglycosylase